MSVVIETTLGDLTVDLFIDQRPLTCLNFLKLCKLKYYNFNLFHTIQHGFIAQTGDPTGKGDGGQSIWGVLEGPTKKYFQGEQIPKIKHTNPGLLSMVGMGDGMMGSQFFFTLASDLISLDGQHCVIGEVTEGVEILRLLNETICDSTYRPYRDVRITHTVILEDPFNDPQGLQAPSRSPSPSAGRLAGGRIAPDEELDETKGKTEEEIAEMIEAKEAKARATILEIVGDLPDADMAPPENVLFVCKLNPVTSDDDLEIIFSRFGKINCCEVIRDRKSGDSLQYAFIEFDNKKSCEDAYFKMDNVLIDDRRIHVDFSQSVSKIKWRGKGRGVIHMDNDGKPINEGVTSRSNRDPSYQDKRKRNWEDQSGKKNGKSDEGNNRDPRSERTHSYWDNKSDYHRDRHYTQRYSRERSQQNSGERKREQSPRSSRRGENRSPLDYRTGKNYNSRDNTSSRGSTLNNQNTTESFNKVSNKIHSPNRGYTDTRKYNCESNNSRRERTRSPRRERSKSPRRENSPPPRTQYGESLRKESRRPPKKESCRSPKKVRSRSPKKERSRSPKKGRSRSPKKERSISRRSDHQDTDVKKSSNFPSTSNIRETAPITKKDSSTVNDKHATKDVKSKKRKSQKSVDPENKTVDEAPPVKRKKNSSKLENESKKSKNKRRESSSESSSSSSDDKMQSKKKRKVLSKKSKKTRTKSSSTESTSSSSSSHSSDSSEDSSTSSSSDSEPKKKSKKKKNAIKKKKVSSSSSSSASTSSSSNESSSSDSGHEASRKKFKNKKSIREKKLNKKKHKK